MVFSVAGFALMNLIVKFLQRIPPTELVLFRSLVSLVLSVWFIHRQKLNPWGNQRLILILRGLFGAIALTLFFYSLQKLPLGTALIIQYLSPIFTSLFAIFILKEPMRHAQWVFFAISLLGVVIIKGYNANLSPYLLGLGVLSAIFSGLAYNMVRLLRDTEAPIVVVFYFPLVATPIMLVFSLSIWVMPLGWEWGGLLLMGILTQFAQLQMTKALQKATLNRIAGFKYLGVAFALIFDIVIFNVQYAYTAIIGMCMVILGVVLNLISKK